MTPLRRVRTLPLPDPAATDAPDRDDQPYEPPAVVDLGAVRRVTLGSSSSGHSDANSQYYW